MLEQHIKLAIKCDTIPTLPSLISKLILKRKQNRKGYGQVKKPIKSFELLLMKQLLKNYDKNNRTKITERLSL